MMADMFALVLGGPAAVESLMDGGGRAPKSTVRFNPMGVHPTPVLRVPISLELLLSDTLARLIEVDGITGVTANPSIFEKTIGTHDYDGSIRGLAGTGCSPMPIYDPKQSISYLRDFMILFNPGDIVKYRAIERDEYEAIGRDVEAGRFEPRIRPVSFSLDAFHADPAGSNTKLLETLHGH